MINSFNGCYDEVVCGYEKPLDKLVYVDRYCDEKEFWDDFENEIENPD